MELWELCHSFTYGFTMHCVQSSCHGDLTARWKGARTSVHEDQSDVTSERSCFFRLCLIPWQTCVVRYPAKYNRLPWLLETEHLLQNPLTNRMFRCALLKRIFLFLWTRKLLCRTRQSVKYCNMNARSVSKQRLDKHVQVNAINNRMNVYCSLVGNSQRTNKVAGYELRDSERI
jgi:hypothetical protein